MEYKKDISYTLSYVFLFKKKKRKEKKQGKKGAALTLSSFLEL